MFDVSFTSPSAAPVWRSDSISRRNARRRRGDDDEERLTADIIELARQYGRYGYRKIAALLRHAGWLVNDKRVERIWRREGLKVPCKQPERGRLWLYDGSYFRLRRLSRSVSLSAFQAEHRAVGRMKPFRRHVGEREYPLPPRVA